MQTTFYVCIEAAYQLGQLVSSMGLRVLEVELLIYIVMLSFYSSYMHMLQERAVVAYSYVTRIKARAMHGSIK